MAQHSGSFSIQTHMAGQIVIYHAKFDRLKAYDMYCMYAAMPMMLITQMHEAILKGIKPN